MKAVIPLYTWLQQEIIAKQRRIYDLEGTLVRSLQEVHRLKVERDRLVEISNDLRAQLNKTKRMVSEYKGLLRKATNSLDTDVDPVQAGSRTASAMG